ncbi:MAG TPA: PAS domain-containing protein, partial [Spirochaetales bacterium]|nr:PAS domain-containing protein [Spirochaetales bacterium]
MLSKHGISDTHKHILLVEDEAIIALDEINRLRSYGYQAEHVLSGEQAVAVMAERGSSFGLILMDIDLGRGMDGPEAARRILETHDVPVVFLSSHTERSIVERTESITSYGYVVKSSGITVLDVSIKMAYKLHAARRDIEAVNTSLTEARGLVNSIIERISDGFVAFDHDMNYTYVNEMGGKLLGRLPADLVGRNYWTEYPEARGTPFAQAYSKALATQEPVFFEDFYAPWNRWFENRVYPSEGGITVFFSEITERKLRQLDMEHSEQRFRSLCEES